MVLGFGDEAVSYGYPQRPPQAQFQPAPPIRKPKNGFGTSLLVIGVAACIATVCSPNASPGEGLAMLLGILGVVFGSLGIHSANGRMATNKASAVAGLVTSIAAPVIAVISVVSSQ